MRVQPVVMPVSGALSQAVLDDGWQVVAPAERYLGYLAAIERSPNTVRAYAHGLSLWFEFLGLREVAWSGAHVEVAALRNENEQLRQRLAETLGQQRTQAHKTGTPRRTAVTD